MISAGSIDLRRLFPVRPARAGVRWLVSLILLVTLLTAFWACGIFSAEEFAQAPSPAGPALFFSVIIAYIVPIFGYISERTAAAVDALGPLLDETAEQHAAWCRRIYVKPRLWLLTVLGIAIAAGLAHNLLLFGSLDPLLLVRSPSAATSAIAWGTMLVWSTVTFVIAALLDNALLLNRLAGRVRVQPFHPISLRPFATVAVISTLALIGAQAAFPIMTIEDDMNPAAYLPGLIATGIPMLLIAALPVWPVHRQLAAAKRELLADVNARIAALPLPDAARPESIVALTQLLAYRREVMQISEWPFDVGVMTRLALYLIIPPLTWVGAALIENLVDAFL
ncbi:MAG TPA: hypothetical protein VF210_14855 [Pseudomonadales bacterium]